MVGWKYNRDVGNFRMLQAQYNVRERERERKKERERRERERELQLGFKNPNKHECEFDTLHRSLFEELISLCAKRFSRFPDKEIVKINSLI